MSRSIIFGKEAREKIKKGVDTSVKSIAVTMGARGRNVVINQNGSLKVTKDGATVASSVNLEDEIENIGASLIKEVANKTANDSGDGTSATSILTQQMLEKGLDAISNNHNPHEIKKGMDMAVRNILEEVGKNKIDITGDKDRLKQIATISANGDEEMGELVSNVVSQTGLDGIVMVSYSQTEQTTFEINQGTKVLGGYASSFFINNENQNNITHDKPLIVLFDGTISTFKDMEYIIKEYYTLNTTQPLVFFTGDINGEALNSLLINNSNGTLLSAAVCVQGLKSEKLEALKDLQALVGGTIISDTKGILLKDFKASMFGEANSLNINREQTIIYGDNTVPTFTKRVQELKSLIELKKEEVVEQAMLKGRLARLLGIIGKIYVGGSTEAQMKERKDRVDDAVGASTAALSEGIVVGGGIALFRSRKVEGIFENESQKLGYSIVVDSVDKPLKQILHNGYYDVDKIVKELSTKEHTIGYDVKNECYTDMFKSGIIDPYKVVRNCLENSTAIVGLLLTTECIIND